MHHVYSTGSRNIQVTQLFSGPEVATSIERIQKPRHARPTWTQADHLGHPCKGPGARFPNLPRNLAISEVDIAWDFDGYGPIVRACWAHAAPVPPAAACRFVRTDAPHALPDPPSRRWAFPALLALQRAGRAT
jgi:hypothetical protein